MAVLLLWLNRWPVLLGQQADNFAEDSCRRRAWQRLMWRTDTYWFDVAIATSGLMLGHLYFGRFEEHKPRWRLLLKSLLGVAIVVATTAFLGRTWMYVLLGAIAVGLLIVHGWWLPRNGVNGWTAEPRERYYELIGLDPSGKPRRDADTTPTTRD